MFLHHGKTAGRVYLADSGRNTTRVYALTRNHL